MAIYGEQLLSKIVDDGNTSAITKYGIERDDFPTAADRQAYDFIVKYARENSGRTPSYASLTAEFPDLTYLPGVTDSYEYLARELKDAAAKRMILERVNGYYDEEKGKHVPSELGEAFQNKSPEGFSEYLKNLANEIIMKSGTSVRINVGTALPELAKSFREEYEKRKLGRSFKLWKTPFASLNDEIGGLYSGDIYGIMAESGRGKTYLSEVFVEDLLRQGAKVLVKSYEVKWYPWLSRLISIKTAREGVIKTEDISEGPVGIPNKQILSGQLDEPIEDYLFDMLTEINSYYPGELILQAKGDEDLSRSLDDLDRELRIRDDFDVVVIDPFYGLSDVYGNNANKTTGGAAEQAARKFERIIGEHDVVGIFTIQAQTERQETEHGQQRELRLPKRDQVKTTKAVLEIATNLFAFDATNGNGRLGVEKGRNGGEGFTLELITLMDYGVLRELPKRIDACSQFVSEF